MDQSTKNQIECFEKEYGKIYSEGPEKWNKDKLDAMKNLQKIMYYLEVRCAMKDNGEYPGSEYMRGGENSYARGRDAMTGRFISRNNSMDGRRSGHYYPPYEDEMPYYNDSNGRSNEGGRNNMGSSGRRFYDSERQKALSRLRQMTANEEGEKKRALDMAIMALESED